VPHKVYTLAESDVSGQWVPDGWSRDRASAAPENCQSLFRARQALELVVSAVSASMFGSDSGRWSITVWMWWEPYESA